MKNLFKAHPVGCVILLSSIMLLPLMMMRDFTPSNELRYLSIADEAIAEGHIFTFTNQGKPYADKPPLYFWMIMLCRTIFGRHSIFVLSLLSLVPAFIILTVMDKWLKLAAKRHSLPAYSAVTRAASALMMMTTALFLGMSIFLRMDMMMCMFIVLALYTFYRMYTGEGSARRDSYLMPLFIFLALFTKGPVGLLVPPVTILVFLLMNGKLHEADRYLGLKTWGTIALLCTVWFAGVYIEGGKEYLDNLLFHQTVDRAVNAFHHKEPFWYYFLTIWYVTAPYSIVLIPAMAASFFIGRKDGRQVTDTELLFASAAISTMAMLSCFSSKLAIYLAPIFPFLVYMFPLVKSRCGWNRYFSAGFALPAAIFAAAGLAALVLIPLSSSVTQLAPIREYAFARSAAAYIAAAMIAAGGISSLVCLFRTKSWQYAAIALSLSMLTAVFSASFTLPLANDYIGYGNLCHIIKENTGTEETAVMTLFVNRPENMDVYLGHDIIDYGKDPDAFLESAPAGGLVIATTERIAGNPELEAFLKGKDLAQCGPYTIYQL